MFSLRRFAAACWVRSVEFLRDRPALAWNLVVPILMVLGFAAIFSGPPRPLFKVGVISEGKLSTQTLPFDDTRQIQFHAEPDREKAIAKIARHRIDLLLDMSTAPARYWRNPESGKGQVLEALLMSSAGTPLQRQEVSGRAVRYVDWVMPGILGMNIMFSCLWGVGFVIVRYRKSGHLKRLQATPLTAMEFISAQIASRMIVVMMATVMMYVACDLFLDFEMAGSYWDLLLITALGAMALTSMGLLVAARVSSEEISGGLLNILSAPMMILSGVFFSLDGAPRFVQLMAECLPLTHLLNAARGIMLDGAGIQDLGYPIVILLLTTGVCLGLGACMFKWTRT
tara:strand:+ start:4145 stop:5167 length:1023 start_codon:yes stop_codon:yes gene_type:complete